RLGEALVGACQLIGPERTAGAVQGERLADDDEVSRRKVGIEGAAGAHPDGPPDPELAQLGEDDRGARPADSGRLDAQRPAVGRLAGVSPEATAVIAHLRLGQQLLREGQGPARVAGEERLWSVRRAGAEVVRHRARICRGTLAAW